MAQDLEKLQGEWTILSLEIDGQKLGGMGARMEVHGTRFTTSGMGADYSGTLSVNQEARPRSFDLKFETGPEVGNTSLGIYELDGDSWKICLTTRGSERPREFAAPAGTGIALEILRRTGACEAAEAPAAKAAAASGEGAEELAGEWKATTLVRDGDALPPSMLSHGKRTATADEVTVKFGPQVILKARYSVDRSKSPMTMDYELANGKRQAGIWKLEGRQLTTCFGAPETARPAQFASTKGDGLTLAVWTPAGK
ncbi:MAG: TIGR03067 domain-containing protein [Candidatus Solibacter sp.]